MGGTLTYLSLGCGVQSSALLVMSALGLRGCPRADFAVFADTQDESQWTYEYLAFLRRWVAAHEMPIYSVTKGRLSDDPTVRIPAFVLGKDGRGAPLSRNCTRDYKIQPIHSFVRRHMRERGISSAVALMGISLDEAHRMTDARPKWLRHDYPLVDARMTRSACAKLLEENGLPVPRKSACVYCPWHSDAAWRETRDHDPAGWFLAVEFDRRLRAERGASLHRSMIPLADVRLGSTATLFGNECEGVCGV